MKTLPAPAPARQARPGTGPPGVVYAQAAVTPLQGAEPGAAFIQKQHPGRREAPNRGGEYPAQVLTPTEVAAMISRCSAKSMTGIRNRALLTLLYRSGLRVSEVLALRPSDIDTGQHSIRVRRTKSHGPQTRGLNNSADDALHRWLDFRKARGLHGGPLFCTVAGGPLMATYVRNLMRRLAREAGIDKRVHPHGLRHTFASEMEHAGETVTTISKALGHSSPGVTARYLDHLTNAAAVKRVAEATLPPLEVQQ